jgi:hypothetical protein
VAVVRETDRRGVIFEWEDEFSFPTRAYAFWVRVCDLGVYIN